MVVTAILKFSFSASAHIHTKFGKWTNNNCPDAVLPLHLLLIKFKMVLAAI